MVFKRIFGRNGSAPATVFAIPPGQRVYAVGDIHGRADLLEALLEMIRADDAARGHVAETRLIFLGDLVDRGPASCEVVAQVMELMANDPLVACLKGNHEEMLIRCCRGDRKTAGMFNRNGGRETLLSYGVDEVAYEAADLGDLVALAAANVPEAHIAFLDSLPDWLKVGDYVFVHAGVRPGVTLPDQSASDMRWIRSEFTEFAGDHGAIIVHGHTITEAVDAQPNRIGIDTGAFATGRLTAIGLEGSERWFLQTGVPI